MLTDHAADAVKVGLPVSFVLSSLAGIHWGTWSYMTATFYSVLMICLTAWERIIKPILSRHKGRSE